MGYTVEVDGLDELRRAIRKSTDQDLPKRMGQAHREVGQYVIARLRPRPDPDAIGRGAGAKVRPSAAKREVVLRSGGKHRAGNTPQQPWGKRQPSPERRRSNARPFIVKTAEDHRDDIGRFYLQAIKQAVGPAFDSWSDR